MLPWIRYLRNTRYKKKKLKRRKLRLLSISRHELGLGSPLSIGLTSRFLYLGGEDIRQILGAKPLPNSMGQRADHIHNDDEMDCTTIYLQN
jgi:hypothetical protein